jgi:2-methylisocitrate lyase-like PEP mutase family enzyme
MQTSAGKRLKTLIEAPEILVLPGVFDGFSTRLVSHAGYSAAFITGSGVSESRLGQSDVGIMGMEENVAAARAIAACSDLLLLADADTGYGNAVNVYHTVRALSAGVAGLMSRTRCGQRCGHMKGMKYLAERWCKDSRRGCCRNDPDFVIKSRTDVLATHGLAGAIRRLNLYAEAGADLLCRCGDVGDDIATIARNVNKPLSVNMGFGIRQRSTTPLLSARELQDLGVAAVIYPRLLTACALHGMQQGLALLQQSVDTGKVVDRPDALVSFEVLHDIMGMAEVEDLEQRFLTPSQLEAKYGRSGETAPVPGAGRGNKVNASR